MLLDYKRFDLFGKLLVEKAVLDAPDTRPIPMHDEACFLYVIGGRMQGFSSQDAMAVQAREGVLMKCGRYMGRLQPDEETERYEALAVHFYPDTLQQIYANDLPGVLKRPQARPDAQAMVRVASDVLIEKFIESLLFYFEHPAIVTEELLVLKVKELILLLLNTSHAPAVREILSNLFTPDVHSFKEIIEAHLFTDITLPELAGLTHQSLATFKRTFKKHYGESPGRYIKHRRLEKARELLVVTDTPIGHIAYDCGFNDTAHFSRSFKARYGCPPRVFRAGRRHMNRRDNKLS